MIELARVCRSYGKKVAVDELSLSTETGEIFAFLGPNGAGKTTTIKMMVGLLRPNSGRIEIGGIDVAGQPRETNRLVGYVPDQPYLYDKLTGREFLQFVGELRGMPSGDLKESIEKQTAMFDLETFIDHLSESYSHGMKQRVVFASALLHRPRVLIVDEPMVGLDPRSIRKVKDLFRREAASGTTIFMSTHTLAFAEEIADRIGVIDRGRLRFLGTVDNLRHETESHDSTLEQLFLDLTEDEELKVQSRESRVQS